MIKAGSEKHRKLIGVKAKTNKGAFIPKETGNILGGMIYNAYARGAPIEGAIRKGIELFNDYWINKNRRENEHA